MNGDQSLLIPLCYHYNGIYYYHPNYYHCYSYPAPIKEESSASSTATTMIASPPFRIANQSFYDANHHAPVNDNHNHNPYHDTQIYNDRGDDDDDDQADDTSIGETSIWEKIHYMNSNLIRIEDSVKLLNNNKHCNKQQNNNHNNQRYHHYHRCLKQIFSKLSIRDLLNVSLVCHAWRDAAKETIHGISHLKLIPPAANDYLSAPCRFLPDGEPCARRAYFCAQLKPYKFLADANFRNSQKIIKNETKESKKSREEEEEEEGEVLPYFDQIIWLRTRLAHVRIRSLDVFACPRLPSALAFLINTFAGDLDRLCLERIACMYRSGAANRSIWSAINRLPKLTKLALIQIGAAVPREIPILARLDEFHLATASRTEFDDSRLLALLRQLGPNLRKLSLNLIVSGDCLRAWFRACPRTLRSITALELFLKRPPISPNLRFELICDYFPSLVKLSLIVGDDRALYLDIFRQISRLKLLRTLALTEDSRDPRHCVINTIKAYADRLEPSRRIRTLCLEISLPDYRIAATSLSLIFPALTEIAFRSLDIDSYCICPPALSMNDGDDDDHHAHIDNLASISLTDCSICCEYFREMLRNAFPRISRIYGIDQSTRRGDFCCDQPTEDFKSDRFSISGENENWAKCRYRWL